MEIKSPYIKKIDERGYLDHIPTQSLQDSRRQTKDLARRPKGLRRHVFACPKPRGTDGPLLQILRHYQLLQFKW